MACEQVFAERLRRSGLRMTAQRECVLHVLHHIEGYATAEEIHRQAQAHAHGEQARSGGKIVDISTVYRTLELLRSFGLVAAIDLGDGQARYELVGLGAPHLHLVCQGCGAISVVPMSAANPLLSQLLSQHGFEASLDDVTIPGLCAECRAATDAAAPAELERAG